LHNTEMLGYWDLLTTFCFPAHYVCLEIIFLWLYGEETTWLLETVRYS
jgi:hypothetical protein